MLQLTLSVRLSIHASIHLSIYLPTYLPTYLHIYLIILWELFPHSTDKKTKVPQLLSVAIWFDPACLAPDTVCTTTIWNCCTEKSTKEERYRPTPAEGSEHIGSCRLEVSSNCWACWAAPSIWVHMRGRVVPCSSHFVPLTQLSREEIKKMDEELKAYESMKIPFTDKQILQA